MSKYGSGGCPLYHCFPRWRSPRHSVFDDNDCSGYVEWSRGSTRPRRYDKLIPAAAQCRVGSRLIMHRASRSSGSRTYVVGCDFRSDIRVFSGITYHLALEGMEAGLLTGMVNLYPRGVGAWP